MKTNSRRNRGLYAWAYNSQFWLKTRAKQLKYEPLCAVCRAVATVVDHVEPLTRKEQTNLDLFKSKSKKTNLQSLCRPCHDSKTALERGNNFIYKFGHKKNIWSRTNEQNN